jgi:hypothetical protein
VRVFQEWGEVAKVAKVGKVDAWRGLDFEALFVGRTILEMD